MKAAILLPPQTKFHTIRKVLAAFNQTKALVPKGRKLTYKF